jgi:hypothetical protein
MGQLRRFAVLVMAVGLVVGGVSAAAARSLANQLANYIQRNGNVLLNTQFPDTITPVIERLGAQATDFPVPPTTPGYVFVYNAQEGIFERYAGSLGPLFLERVETVGKNHVSLGVSYLYGNVDQFDGSDLAEGPATAIGGTVIDPQTGQQVTSGVFLDDFQLPTHKINFAASYGVTDDWDVGFLIPLVVTKLKVRGTSFLATSAGTATLADPPLDASSVGVGDLLLRTKYRFGYLFDWGIAGGFILRVPTGDEADFHGLGDTTVEPQLIISRAFGVQDVHANFGLEFNADNSSRSRALYGIGATLQHPSIDWLAFLLDFIGSSGLDDETFTTTGRFNPNVQGQAVIAPFLTSQTSNGGNSFTVVSTLPRADQVYAAVGIKFAIYGDALGYLNAVVPLTRQGLQADVISAAGVQYTF